MKNNSFKYTFWLGISMISIFSLVVALIGINVYNFLEDKITIRTKSKDTGMISESFEDSSKTIYDTVTIYTESPKKLQPKILENHMDSQSHTKTSNDSITPTDSTSSSAPLKP